MTTYIVTTANDEAFDNDGNDATDGGGLSLREAIGLANANDGVDTITFNGAVFTGGASSLIRLTEGELVITDGITIDGTGGTDIVITGDENGDDTLVDGTFITDVAASGTAGTLTDNSRVISNTSSSANLTLEGVTITGGRITGHVDEHGGGVYSAGTLTITGSTISGNSAANSFSDGGGGVHGAQDITISGSTISGNYARGSGGGVHGAGNVIIENASTVSNNSTTGSSGRGGGVFGSGTVTISGSTISGNSTATTYADGGGVFGSGTVTITGSTVSNNSTAGTFADGGGVAGSGTVTITDSIVSNNSTAATYAVGGGVSGSGIVTISGSDISGNSTAGYNSHGGGVYGAQDVTIENASTVNGNSATGVNAFGGGVYAGGNVNITNDSTVSNNDATSGFNGDLTGAIGEDDDTIGGTATFRDADTGDNTFTADTITGTYGELTIAADGTWTYDLDSTDSTVQALNAGDTLGDTIAVQSADGTSQDIIITINGADEMATFTVTTTNDTGDNATVTGDLAAETADGGGLSLREAIGLANADAAVDTITFAAGLAGSTLTLMSGELVISESVTIDGDTDADNFADITISGADTSRIFNIDLGVDPGTTVTLDALTITGGYAAGRGGAILATGTGDLTIENSSVSDSYVAVSGGIAKGGGLGIIDLSGNVTISNSAFTGNEVDASPGDGSSNGGAISAQNQTGTLAITDSTISGNNSFYGGGVGVDGVPILNITGSTIVNNSASGGGGMLVLGDVDVNIEGSTFAGNYAEIYHAWYAYGGSGMSTFSVTDSILLTTSDSAGLTNGDYIDFYGHNLIGGASEGFDVGTNGTGTYQLVTISQFGNIFDDATTVDFSNVYGVGAVTGVPTGVLTDRDGVGQSMVLQNAANGGLADGTGSSGGDVGAGPVDVLAVVGGTATGSVTEGNVGDAAVTASGTLTITDADPDDTDPSFADVSSTTGDNGYGSFVLTSGTWTYTLDQSAVQNLAAGDQVTDTITFIANDGATQQVSVTINGTNDVAVFSGAIAGRVDGAETGTINSTVIITDPDDNEDSFTAETVNGTYGDLTIATDGSWTYDLDETNSAVQALSGSDTLQDTLSVSSVDGSTQDITITINAAATMATYVVTTLDDQTAETTDLATETDDGGGLSLREALAIANADVTADTIIFHSDLSGGTLTLSSGDLTISESVTIDGDTDGDNFADITISGADTSRIFTIDLDAVAGDAVTLDALAITGGSAIRAGGAILATGTGDLTIQNSSVSDSYVADSGSEAKGGGLGIENLVGDVTISNSAFTNNSTDISDLGDREGGAISTQNQTGTLAISNSTISGNNALYGGAIYADNTSAVTITGSTIANNSAGYGGGLGTTGAVDITIEDSTFVGNISLYVGSVYASGTGTLSITDSIILAEADVNVGLNVSSFRTVNFYGTNLIGGDTKIGTTDSSGSYTPVTVSEFSDIFDDATTVDFIGIYSRGTVTGVPTGALTDSGGVGQTIALANGGLADGTGSSGGDVGAGPVDVLAVVSGTTTGSVTEGDAGDAAVTASGTLTITDADPDDTPGFADVSSTTGDNGYGSFVLTSGTWTYTLDQSAVQNLAAGDQVTDTITFTAADGATQQVTVTITGTDDAAVIGGTTTGSVNEGEIGTINGTLTITDPDDNEDSFTAETVNGTYGDLTIAADGGWTYDLDETNSAVRALDGGETLQDTLSVTSVGGDTQDITITINGLAAQTFVVTTASDVTDSADGVLSLREAIAVASPGDTVTFDGSLAGQTITLSSGDLDIDKDLIIDGDFSGNDDVADITISGGGVSRIFNITDGTVVLNSLNIENGSADNGGAISITGNNLVTINNSTISDSDATASGGGVFASGSGGLEIYNSLILGNDALNGGGLSYEGTGQLRLDSTTVTQNSASGDFAGGVTISSGPNHRLVDLTITGNVNTNASPVSTTANDLTITSNPTGVQINDSVIGSENTLTAPNVAITAATVTATGPLLFTEATGFTFALGSSGSVTENVAVADIFHATSAITVGGVSVTTGVPTDNGQSVNSIEVLFGGAADGTGRSGDDIGAGTVGNAEAVIDFGDSTTTATFGEKDTISGTLSIVDPDGDNLFVPIAGEVGDNGTFTLAANGDWTFTLDQADADVLALNTGGTLVNTFTVTSADGLTTQDITINVTGVNDAPNTIALDNLSVDENDFGGTVGTLSAIDPEGEAITFSVVGDARFEVDGTTLKLADDEVLDFEAAASNPIVLTVRATDATGAFTDEDFSITINDLTTGINQSGTSGADTLTGTDDRDTLSGGEGDDSIDGGDAGDSLSGDGGNDTLNGGSGGDTLEGGSENDRLEGGAGNDTLNGNGGNDILLGGDDNDRLYGNAGNDSIEGNDGADLVIGFDGDDTIKGGAGNDTLHSGEIIPNATGNDLVFGGSGNDSIQGDNGNDTLSGGDDNDTLDGSNGDDSISGDAGDDTLLGGAGSDTLFGGDGNDTLRGGTLASSDDESDFFVLNLSDATGGIDVLDDFDPDHDFIVLPHDVVSSDLTISGGTISYNGNDVATFSGSAPTEDNFVNVNALPTSDNASIIIDEDNSHTFTGAEFAFADGDSDALVSVRIDTVPANGTLFLSGAEVSAGDVIAAGDLSNLVYTPDANFNGADAFEFSVSDGFNANTNGGFSAVSNEIAFTINAVEDMAVVTGDTTGSVDEAIDDGASVTASGTITASDAEGDAVTIVPVTDVTGDNGFGTFSLNSDGEWTYTLNNAAVALETLDTGDTAEDTLTFQTSDGVSHDITVTINGVTESQTFVVTTASDVVDDTDGVLSLREALALANAEEQADAITFDASLAGETITLTGGQLVISEDVTIDGDFDGSGDNSADITIGGNNSSQIFDITNSSVVTLDALTITEGYSGFSGGAVQAGTGTNLYIANSTISDSYASYSGGAIYMYGGSFGSASEVLSITNSLITGNEALNGGGIVTSETGGEDRLYISGTTITQNISQYYLAGGVSVYRGGGIDVEITGSTISGNVNTHPTLLTSDQDGTSDELHFFGANIEISNSIIGGENTSAAPNISIGLDDDYSATFTGPVVLTEATAYDLYENTTVGIGSIFDGGGNATISTTASIFAQTETSTLTDGDGNSADVTTGVLTNNIGTVETIPIAATGPADGTGTGGQNIGAGSVAAGIGGDVRVTVGEDETGTVGGTLTINDPDGEAENSFTAETVAGTHGELTITTGGAWTYDLDETSAVVQALVDGEELTDVVGITSFDGTPQDITITINGADDAAVIGGTIAASVNEDETGTVGGTLTVTDADANQDSFTAGTVSGSYGDLTIDVDGNWSYNLDETDSDVRALSDGDALQDTVSVSSVDGTTQDITITINGANDAPDAVADNITGSEDNTVFFNVLTNDSDPEGDSLSISSIDTSGVSSGVVTMLDASTGAFSFDPDGAFDGLFEGEQQDVSFTYTVTDGEDSSTQTVTITVEGEGTLVAAMQNVDENEAGATVGQLSSAPGFDALAIGSGDVFTTSDSRFEVSEDGVISLVDPVSLDYETETSVDFTITRTRGSDGVVEDIDVTVTVDDVAAGSAQDGYIANALVFIDTDGDGVYDAGTDPATVTDAGGNFELPQDGNSGPLVLQGGVNPITNVQAVDISTGLDFNGTLTAPEGSTVVTPVTTLIHSIAGLNATPAAIASAETQVSSALGINDSVELTTFDPINAALNGDGNGVEVHAAGTQVLNTVVLAAAAVEGAGGTGGDAAAFDALADTVENASGALDLGDTTVVSTVITNAGTQAGADAGVVTTAATSTAAIIADTNAAVDTVLSGAANALDALTGVTQTAIVAQGDAASDLETAVTAAGGGDTSQLTTAESNYTDANLTTAVDNATVGIIEPGRVFTGTSAGEALSGAGGDDTLRGLGGDDTLDGEAGTDRFVIDGGSSDTIVNFDTANEVVDLTDTNTYGLDFSGTGGSLVTGSGVSENGGNLVITLGNGETLTLNGVTAGNVTSANFAFATNTAPTAADNTLSTDEDTAYVLMTADFGYNDADGDVLSVVRIDSLPTGTLTLNGSNVTAGQEIDVVDIAGGLLVFTPAENATGTGLTSFTFSVSDGTDFAASSSTISFNVSAVNDAPTASDNSITIEEDTSRRFNVADFNFADVDGGTLQSVRIDTLTVTSGTFQLSGANVSAGQVIAVADIAAGNLVYTPEDDANGSGLLTLTFTVNDGTAFASTSSTLEVDVTDAGEESTSSGSGSSSGSGTTSEEETPVVITEEEASSASETIEGSSSDDAIAAGAGNDEVDAGRGNDTLKGDAGDDTLSGGLGTDFLDGGADNDMLAGDQGDDTLLGGAGDDTIEGGSNADFLRGDDGDDRISGGSGDDRSFAGPDDTGNDTVQGNAGNDELGAGAGDDVIVGGDANATVSDDNAGDAGNDTLYGADGNDLLVGGSYNTETGVAVVTGTGNNLIWAGNGNDTIFGDGEDDILGGGVGADNITGGAGSDVIYGGIGEGDGNDDTLSGGDGNDEIFAAADDDVVEGGTDDDLLFGGDGNDSVDGGAGNDTIWGGAGDDMLAGGTGSDTFSFISGFGTDVISDFGEGAADEDMLNFSEIGGLTVEGIVAAATFEGGNATLTVANHGTIILTGIDQVELQAIADNGQIVV